MKRLITLTSIILALAVTFTACQKDEDAITPSGNYSPIRGGFPQGESKYDSIINDIKNEYGVYLLYKDITETDLNRNWLSTGTGDIYVAGPEEERDAACWNLPEEQLPYYVDYFRNEIFSNISKEFANSAFHVKMYMIDNLRTEPRDFGEDSGVTSGGTTTDPRKLLMKGNFDSWAISFTDEMMNSEEAAYALKQQRCMLIIELIKNVDSKNELGSPDEFWSGFNFADTMDIKNPAAEKYKYKLGFVDMINDNFGTGQRKQVWVDYYFTSTSYWEKSNPNYNLFTTYIKNIMWLTTEEFEERYPIAKYPMIHEKRDIVIDYMLEAHGINLLGISYGNKKQ
jgi:hypothetical protein